MKKFFGSLNLARWILLLSVVLAGVLAFTGWRLHQRRLDLEGALTARVPLLAQDIQVQSRRYTRLYEEADGAGMIGQTDVMTYLRELASDRDVQLGALDITRQTPQSITRDIVDEKYAIKPASKDRGFVRVNLANFMHLIEQRSRRMRVTQITLDREGNPKPWEYGNDRWKWQIEVTSRKKQGEQ